MKTTGRVITSIILFGISGICCLFAQTTDNQNKTSRMDKFATPHTEEFVVNTPIEKVFDFIVAEDVLPKILKKYFIIPAVTGSKIHQGDWVTPGSYRTVFFANGDTLKEELTDFDRPTYFAYKVSEFSSFQKRFASYGTGQWWFKANGDKTEVKWTYTFYAKSRFKRFFLKPFINHDFRTYMKRSIKHIKKQIENGK
jgi:hypothetical protein